MKIPSLKRVAIVYDRVNKWGGAERVLLALHEVFPNAPLYTSVYDTQKASWAKVFPKVHTSFLQKLPFAKSNHEFLAPLMPLAFQLFNFDDYDLVVSVTSEAAKGIKTKRGTLHICYCLTPTRYLWSHHDEYFKEPFKSILNPLISILRKWDKRAAKVPNTMISISKAVQKRIKKYYGRKTNIVFPPVDIKKHNKISLHKQQGKYFLVVSRLVGYKKVDLVVKTFNKLEYPLVIIGTGRQEKRLKSMSKSKNIKFVGQVSDKKLEKYYSKAKALIMPQEEDFGIVSVEAQHFGVPVIAFNKGGAIDTVVDGKTGIFFNDQTVDSLTEAIAKFTKIRFNHRYLVANAKKFSKENFKSKFLREISKL